MNWLRISLGFQIALAAYFEAVLWFPLGAWNDQPGDRLIALVHQGEAGPALMFASLMLLPLLLFSAAYFKRWFWFMVFGCCGYAGWAILQIESWWIPWIFGPDARALRNAHALSRTYKLFPSSPGHLAPDAMHFVLDLLLFASIGTLAVGLVKMRGASTT